MTTRDWGAEAHAAAVQRIRLCEESLDDGPPAPGPGGYCGCEDCEIRQILDAAWPIIEAAVRSGDFDTPPIRRPTSLRATTRVHSDVGLPDSRPSTAPHR